MLKSGGDEAAEVGFIFFDLDGDGESLLSIHRGVAEIDEGIEGVGEEIVAEREGDGGVF